VGDIRRSPGFPVKTRGFEGLHAALFTEGCTRGHSQSGQITGISDKHLLNFGRFDGPLPTPQFDLASGKIEAPSALGGAPEFPTADGHRILVRELLRASGCSNKTRTLLKERPGLRRVVRLNEV